MELQRQRLAGGVSGAPGPPHCDPRRPATRWARPRVKVEPKTDTRLRLGRSPGDADALLLAFYVPADREPGLLSFARAETARLRALRLGSQAQ